MSHLSCVGRDVEVARLADAVRSPDASVVFLHGVAGLGKSTLLRAFVDCVAASGVSVTCLDCRVVEPTEPGFLRACAGDRDLAGLRAQLTAGPRHSVLVLDQVEVFRLMDTWLRQVLVPALPPQVVLVLAGRERPVAGWFGVDGFVNMPLSPYPRRRAWRCSSGAAWVRTRPLG